MNKRLALLLLLAPLCLAYETAALFTADDEAAFETWAHAHGRVYATAAERAARMSAWAANARLVAERDTASGAHPRHPSSLNGLADLTFDEYVRKYTTPGLARSLVREDSAASPVPQDAAVRMERTPLPDTLDWRQKGAVGPVKVQGECGACFAFVAAGVMEAQAVIALGRNFTALSEQQMVDCCGTDYAALGCTGGDPGWAMVCLKHLGGVVASKDYPYTTSLKACSANFSKAELKVKSVYKATVGDEIAMQKALYAFGPVTVAVDAASTSFQNYYGGVFQNPSCGEPNHALLAVGWGVTSAGVEYYILKNQWGSYWGIDGYMWWPKNKNNYCGIANWAYIAEVKEVGSAAPVPHVLSVAALLLLAVFSSA